MKIACQSCQAKYTIADEKVVGKVVKIRCKKCGATIVVNGQDTAEGAFGSSNEEMTEVRSSSADFGGQGAEAEGWTVNVADDDQRTLSTAQVVAEFGKGTITDETYCWRDGMGDWLPLREIEELSIACGLTAPKPSAPPPRAASVRPAAAAAPAGGGLSNLFGSSPPPAMGSPAPQAAAAAARRAGGRAGGADLFGAAAEAGGENDVMTSAPQSGSAQRAPVDDGKMTGQRNENSVLFSLNALTATGDPGPKKNGGGGGLLGAAEGDGSGLIDIRALSSAMATSGPKKANHADDIMNLGGGGAFSAALAAPVLTAPPLDSGDPNAPAAGANNQKIFMMFGALALLLILGMVVMFFMLKPAPVVPVATTTPDGTGTAASPTAPGSAAAAAPATTAGAAAPASAAAASAAPGTPPVAVADNSGPTAKAPSVGAKHGGGGGSAATPSPAPEHAAPPPPANNSLDSLMASAAGAKGGSAAPAPAAAATEPFDRGAAAATLGGISESVGSCKKPGGPTGEGHVSITFAPSGHVLSAIVDQPPYAGTAVGGCVAGKFRSAHVPPFAGSNMPVGKRFTIN